MSKHVVLCWCAGFLALGTFAAFRIAIPWLFNMHDTGAILAGLLLGGAVLTADFLIGKEIVSLWGDNEEIEDEE